MTIFTHSIENLVKSLIKKGYLTLSSCEAYKLENKRNIVIAFKDFKLATKFISSFSESSSKLEFKVMAPESYMEKPKPYKEETKNIYLDRKRGSQAGTKMSKKECVLSLNNLFGEDYDDYLLLEMIICPSTKTRLSKLLMRLYARTGRINRVIKKLTKYIEQEVPVYDASCSR